MVETFDCAISTGVRETPFRLVVGDFDGDGRDDFAVLCAHEPEVRGRRPHTLQVFLSNGDGTFRLSTEYIGEFDAFSGNVNMAVGNLNGEMFSDLAVGASFSSRGSNVRTLLNNSDGSFGSAEVMLLGRFTWAITAGDLDLDGFDDLVWIPTGSFLSNGDGTF